MHPHPAVLIPAMLIGPLGTLVAIRISDQPYLWIFPCWGVTFVILPLLSKAGAVKAIGVNAAVAAITLGALEYYWSTPREANGRYAGSYIDGYFLKHDILGHAPPKGASVTASRIYQNQALYEVVYNIDQHGLRRGPPHRQDAVDCLLFFGGSFTFGEGVDDKEAMPYRTGILSGGRYRVFNFGFHAYGAHQMLAALEQGLVGTVTDCEPKYVIYLGMVAHIARAAGLVPWEHHGPWYTLAADGEVKYQGRFDQKPEHRLITGLRLDTSQIYARTLGKQRAVNENDVDLYLAIITTARKVLLEKYPRSEFHVLLWGMENDRAFQHLLDRMTEQNINIHPLSRIIPSYSRYPLRFELSPNDNHPNAMSHDLVARYIVNNILD